MKKYLSILFILILLFTPQLSEARLVDCGLTTGDLCQFDDFIKLIDVVITEVMKFAFMIAIVMISYAGIKYMLSRGDRAKVKEAHAIIQKVVIGLLVLLLSWLLLSVIYSVTKVKEDFNPLIEDHDGAVNANDKI